MRQILKIKTESFRGVGFIESKTKLFEKKLFVLNFKQIFYEF